MAECTYDQYCPLACSLDLLGERWTMLILRDLIPGPKRYTDLRNELDGIPSDLLTSRLRKLEAAGVLGRRRLPHPAAATVYELTERGRELKPALLSLARFGVGLLGAEVRPEAAPSLERLELLLSVLFDPAAAAGQVRSVGLSSGEEDDWLWISFGEGGFAVGQDRAEAPSEIEATADAAPGTLYDLLLGRLDSGEETAAGNLDVEGDHEALRAILAAFPGPAAMAAAVS